MAQNPNIYVATTLGQQCAKNCGLLFSTGVTRRGKMRRNPVTADFSHFVAHSLRETPMFRLHRSLLICLLLGLAGPVLAQREIHVVAVAKGYQTEDYYALPEARVLVDRPGQEIGLVLLDDGELHWKVEATEGTNIGEIIRSGPSPRDSKVTLFGIPMAGVQVSGLPLVFRPLGRKFRTLVDTLADSMETERISSFRGIHNATDVPVKIDHVDTRTAGLARDYLSQLVVASDDLPPKIRDWFDNRGSSSQFTLVFDEKGIDLTGPTGTRRFAATPNVPDIFLPAAAVYDPVSQTIYCITYGAEGYLYSIDVQTGAWAVVTSLDEYDAAGLLYDPESRLLITTGAFSRTGEIKVFGLDGSRSSIFILTTAFPGLTDLFDYGNEHGPPLTPHVYSNGWLLLEAVASHDSAHSDAGAYRIYAVQITTGEVRLLHFGNE
ncbi:hypothetical protein [Aliiroseovarius zhejiangensis]|uniref:hypothetical protein n=1 Tax=Aliiroseovarius zhejiangensis TaxID=1632025 RepID=UPI001E34A788|nr:hypothetical protein [Aliiroseovarius zhejiangensis]